MTCLFPTRTWHRADDPVVITVAADSGDAHLDPAARLVVSSLGVELTSVPVTDFGEVALGSFGLGGYGVDLVLPDSTVLASTAFDVLASPFDRPRYGFLTSFGPEVPAQEVRRHYQRLHLNLAQYYDWAYRHTLLSPPAPIEEYLDALGNPVSTPKLRELIATLGEAGVANLGYAAVYAIEPNEKQEWAAHSLYRADGSTHALGDDFLYIADPSDPVWLDFLVPQIAAAVDEPGFDGFHLDQYGWPKQALRADGTVVDIGAAFVELIDAVAAAAPNAELVFNNVNGFPVDRSAHAAQAALYTEVWPPRTRLGDLAAHIAASRAAARAAGRPASGPGGSGSSMPTIIAAYLSTYDKADPRAADACARLTMATIFSSGATHLLAGERAGVLTDPYYPKHHLADEATAEMLQNWYDFLVRYGDLLLPADLEDVTGDTFGDYNGGITITAPDGVVVSNHPDPGTLWVRVMRVGDQQVVHLINLTGQTDADWDAAKAPIPHLSGLGLRVERSEVELPTWYLADPDRPGPMRALSTTADGNYAVAALPELGAWTTILLPAPSRLSARPVGA